MTESSLQRDNERLHDLMKMVELGWWEADLKNETYYYSDFIADLIGINYTSCSFSIFNSRIRADYRSRVINELFTIKEGNTNKLTFPVQGSDGIIWVCTKYIIKEKVGDNVLKVFGSLQPVETHKMEKTQEATIYKLNNLLYQQSNISKSLFSFLQNEDISNIINKTLHELLAQFNVERCFIIEYNWEKNTQSCIYEAASRNEFLLRDQMQNIPLTGDEWWSKQMNSLSPVILSELDDTFQSTSFYQNILKDLGLKSVMAVPLISRNKEVWGYAGIDAIDNVHFWSNEDYLWFSSMMNVMNICIQFRSSEKKVQEDKEFLQSLYKYMPIGYQQTKIIYENGIAVDYEYVDVNNELEIITGKPASELIGKKGSELYNDAGKELQLQLQVLNTDKHIELDYKIKNANGHKHCRVIKFSPRMDIVISLLLDMTETYHTHKALEESEGLLRNIYESLPIGLEIFDKDGILIQANEKDVEILGMKTKTDYLGVNIFDHPVLPLEVKERMKKGERMDFNSSYEFSRVGDDYYKVKPTKKGVMNLTTKIVPVLDKQNKIQNYLFINIDSTETTNAYIRIQEFEEYFSLIADFAKVGYFKWNMLKKEGFAISQWFKNLEKPSTSLISDDIADIYENLYPEDFEVLEDFYSKALTGEVQTLQREVRVITKDDSLKWLRCTLMVKEYEPENGNIEMIGVSFDITELKEMILAKDKAETLDKLKTAFLANMSHEIRTPLNAIVGFSDLLIEIDNPEEREEYIKIIHHNNDLLLKLISDILDLSKIESEMFELVKGRVEVKDLCGSIVSSMRINETEQVKLLFDNNLPEYAVYGDSNRIAQVISNLINNAFKFTTSGSIALGYRKQDEKNILFYVKDTGIGIPPEDTQRIFDRFVKLDTFVQGTGLGLPVSRSIVEQMGGKLGVESEVGAGSCFWFTHPYDEEYERELF